MTRQLRKGRRNLATRVSVATIAVGLALGLAGAAASAQDGETVVPVADTVHLTDAAPAPATGFVNVAPEDVATLEELASIAGWADIEAFVLNGGDAILYTSPSGALADPALDLATFDSRAAVFELDCDLPGRETIRAEDGTWAVVFACLPAEVLELMNEEPISDHRVRAMRLLDNGERIGWEWIVASGHNEVAETATIDLSTVTGVELTDGGIVLSGVAGGPAPDPDPGPVADPEPGGEAVPSEEGVAGVLPGAVAGATGGTEGGSGSDNGGISLFVLITGGVLLGAAVGGGAAAGAGGLGKRREGCDEERRAVETAQKGVRKATEALEFARKELERVMEGINEKRERTTDEISRDTERGYNFERKLSVAEDDLANHRRYLEEALAALAECENRAPEPESDPEPQPGEEPYDLEKARREYDNRPCCPSSLWVGFGFGSEGRAFVGTSFYNVWLFCVDDLSKYAAFRVRTLSVGLVAGGGIGPIGIAILGPGHPKELRPRVEEAFKGIDGDIAAGPSWAKTAKGAATAAARGGVPRAAWEAAKVLPKRLARTDIGEATTREYAKQAAAGFFSEPGLTTGLGSGLGSAVQNDGEAVIIPANLGAQIGIWWTPWVKVDDWGMSGCERCDRVGTMRARARRGY